MLRNDLDAFWLPFTPNREFKANPRLFVAAKGMHYTTSDGRQFQRQVDLPDGDARAPLSLADLRRKFGGYARASVGEAAADRIEHLMLTPMADTPVRELAAALRA